MDIDTVQKEAIRSQNLWSMTFFLCRHPLFAAYTWQLPKPSLMAETNSDMDQQPSNKYWIEVWLHSADYDLHDIERCWRAKFLHYSILTPSLSSTGVGRP